MHLFKTAMISILIGMLGIGGYLMWRLVSHSSPRVPFGIAIAGDPEHQILDFQRTTGIAPQWVEIFVSWPLNIEDPNAFHLPLDTLKNAIQNIRSHGAIPVITWEPWQILPTDSAIPGNVCPQVIAGEEILSGTWDPYLDAFFETLREMGQPLWIRFAHEMNTLTYHWGFSDGQSFGPEAPFLYRKLFRYVVNRARFLGANQIRWIFCPNAESVPLAIGKKSWNQASRYYPGSDYVDILGMDGYNWGTSLSFASGAKSQWQSFKSIFDALRRELTALDPNKPLMVFETSCVNPVGIRNQNKDQWIQQALKTAQEWHLKGWTWFEVNKENDWRLQLGVSEQTLKEIQAISVQ